jgi:amino acid adenylation domain-containing protein
MNNEQCLHHLFEEQVKLTPNAVAVVQEQQKISYESLNQKANQLAYYLQQQGINPENLVGLCVERSIEMVIAFLGILKAGGAYVPLDPQYPQERLEYMMSDTQMSVMITQSHLVNKLAQNLSQDLTIICIDKDWQHISQEASENPHSEVNASNLAYVIYTSGSTGKPKGVMIEHRSVVEFIEVFKETSKLSHSDRILQFAALSFDVAVEEIYPCLSVGGTVVLRTEAMLNSFSSFMQKCREWQLTVLDLPTAFWHSLVTELARNNEIFPELVRLVFVGGERLLPEKVKLWQQYIQEMLDTGKLSKAPQLINCYGPTETTVEAAFCDLSTYKLAENLTAVPIGKPLPHTQIYVFDEDLQPVAKGMPGELYIGGISLARGYLNRPELTTDQFINNPFNSTERLYKTGDLGRYLEDGNLEYLGRLDHQIKIRGFRVELGEIESILTQHSLIDSAAVICTEEQLGDKRLMAYIVPQLLSGNAVEIEKAQSEYLSLWKTVNQQTDSKTPIQTDITFNIVGWNSSYDGQAIPEREMAEWVSQTVTRIKDLQPQKVLEIGCGTGLLLTRIAPDCTEYVGIDFSRPALDHILKVQQVMGGLDHITLLERTADNLAGLKPEGFDTVIINSVVQHFPSAAYLLQVLEGVIKLVKKAGKILIGDVRNLALLQTYCTSVEVYRGNDNLTASPLQERITRREKAEEELLLSPFFWLALQQQFPQISHVQIKPKAGRYHNELTRFRYEAILHINDCDLKPLKEIHWLDWQSERLNLVEIKRILTEDKPTHLGIRAIANPRLNHEVYTKDWLDKAGQKSSIKQLKQWLSQQPERGIEVHTICELAQELPYHVEISWMNTDATGRYDVVFRHKSLPFQPAFFPIDSAIQELLVYANNPLQNKFNQQLVSQLRSFLKQKLPEYMMPTGIGILEKLPLTPNDKIDRQALANLSPDSYLLSENQANFVAPRTPIEERLAYLWGEVLQLEQIGIHDNFFELGGNSLQVIVLLNRIQEEFNKNLQMVDLFKSPTIAELVIQLQTELSTSNTIETITAHSPDEVRYYPPSFLQERFWTYRHFGSFYQIPNYFHLEGDLNIAILEKSCNEIVRRHEILRTQLQEINGSLVQVVVPTATSNFSVIDLQHLRQIEQHQEIEQLIQQKSQTFVFLDKHPWLSVTLVKLAETSQILLICLHTLIADERSIEIVLQELGVVYDAFLAGKPSPLPELPLQYGDYAIAQRQSLSEALLQARREYWQQWLSREPQPLVLPTDKPLPPVQSFQAETFESEVSPELTAKLQTLSQKQQVTLFTTVAAVLGLLLDGYHPGESVVLGVPVSERNQKPFDSVIGDFGKMWFLRLDLGAHPLFLPLLKRIQQEMLSVIAEQDVPFQQIAKTFQPPIERSQRFFRVYLDFLLGTPKDDLELSGLRVSSIPFQSSMARVDLGLIVWQKHTYEGTSLQVWWRYKTDLFEADTIAQMSARFQDLLEEVINEQ